MSGTGNSTTAEMRLSVSRGAPAAVATTYAPKRVMAPRVNRWNLRSPAGRGAPCRSHSDSYTLIQTPLVEAFAGLLVPGSLVAADVTKYRPNGVFGDRAGRAAPSSDPVRHIEPAGE